MKLGRAIAWIWAVFAGVGGIGIYTSGETSAGLLCLVSASFAFPPLWDAIASRGLRIPTWLRVIGAIATFSFAGSYLPSPETEPDALTLSEVEAKIGKSAVTEMSRADYGETFNRIGAEAFDRANELAKWPAVTAALSPRCDTVEIAAISDQATPDQLQWFVDCTNGERFMINETEAVATRDRFDNVDSDEASAVIPSEVSEQDAKSKDFGIETEAIVVGACDRAVAEALNAKSTFDPAWRYDYQELLTNGRVSVARDFEAENAFGGVVSSRYECLVEVEGMKLISLRVKEPTGWETLFSR